MLRGCMNLRFQQNPKLLNDRDEEEHRRLIPEPTTEHHTTKRTELAGPPMNQPNIGRMSGNQNPRQPSKKLKHQSARDVMHQKRLLLRRTRHLQQ